MATMSLIESNNVIAISKIQVFTTKDFVSSFLLSIKGYSAQLFGQFCKKSYDVDVIKKAYILNNIMVKSAQNSHFLRYDVICDVSLIRV